MAEGGEAHPLDGEADNIHKGQGKVERYLDHSIPGGQFHQQGQLFLTGVQEEHGTLRGEGQHGAQHQEGPAQPQRRAGADAPAQPVQLAGSHVLSAVCGHSGSHGVEGTGQQLKKLGSGRYGGHIETAQGVDGGLEDNGSDGGDGVLQAHGDSHAHSTRQEWTSSRRSSRLMRRMGYFLAM